METTKNKLQGRCSNNDLSCNNKQTKLSQKSMETIYIENHRTTFHRFIRAKEYLSWDHKKKILAIYDSLVGPSPKKFAINKENILEIYAHPMQVFYEALIDNRYMELFNQSSVYFPPKISDLIKAKIENEQNAQLDFLASTIH